MSTKRATYTRSYTARVHQEFHVEIPDEMRSDPVYFDESGDPTPDFDQWVTDNFDIDAEETYAVDDWNLETELSR